MTFAIDTSNIRRYVNMLNGVENNVGKIKTKVLTCKLDSCTGFEQINKQLDAIDNQLSHRVRECKNLFTVLREICDEYSSAEQKILQQTLSNDNPDDISDKANRSQEDTELTDDELKEKIKNAIETLYSFFRYDAKGTLDDYWILDFLMEDVSNPSDALILKAMEMLESNPGDKTIQDQYENNKLEWQQNRGKLLENGYMEVQDNFSNFQYGKESKRQREAYFGGEKMTAADNACEVIAAYNALSYLGEGTPQVDFPELLRDFSKDGMVNNGCFGTSPTAIREYMDNQGYDTNMLIDSYINDKSLDVMQNDYSTYILTAYNNGHDLTSMVHTVSITYENGYYCMHNTKGKMIKYDSLTEAVNGYNGGEGEPISVIGIK